MRIKYVLDRLLLGGVVFFICTSFWAHLHYSHFDWGTFYNAGMRVLEGNWRALYPTQEGMGGFLYPAVGAYFFSAFSWMGEYPARFTYYLFLFLSLGFGVLLCLKHWVPESLSKVRVAWILLLLAARPINDSFVSGNINPFIFLLCLLFFVFPNSKWMKVSLPLASAFKIYPLLLWSLILPSRKWTLFGGVVLTSFLVYMIPFFFPEGWGLALELMGSHLQVLRSPGHYGGLDNVAFQSVPAVLFKIGLPQKTAMLFSVGIGFVLWGGVMWKLFRSQFFSPQGIALFFALIPLFTPASWYHLGVFYLPLFSWAIVDFLTGRKPSQLVLLVFLFITYDLTGRTFLMRVAPDSVMLANLPFVGVFSLFLFQYIRWFQKKT